MAGRRKLKRCLLPGLLALLLVPGLYWRDEPPAPDFRQIVRFEAINLPDEDLRQVGGEGGPVLEAAWQITSPNDDFGSYSALVALDGDDFLAVSDRGKEMRFRVRGSAPQLVSLGPIPFNNGIAKYEQDAESATHDPASGQTWIGYESANSIRRYSPNMDRMAVVEPPIMAGWSANSGPEALERLPDGRFIVLSEGAEDWSARSGAGVLFPGDPVDSASGVPIGFSLPLPEGMRVTDMAALPDGRVLILLRGIKIGFSPRFTAQLVLADPATIVEGEPWTWEDVGTIDPPIPLDNYEGLAVTEADEGRLNLWLISDDNDMFLQRSLLLKLGWTPPAAEGGHEKARGDAARSSDIEDQPEG
jgi:hypothetical protein